MDDLIYFLLVIGWLGYSFYKQMEKKKLQAAKKIEYSQQTMPENQTTVFDHKVEEQSLPNFRKTLEEILLGETQPLEQIPQNEVQSLENIPEPAVSYENQYQTYDIVEKSSPARSNEMNYENHERIDNKHDTLQKEIVLVDEEEKNLFWNGFDLRNAVIYSEILNRKYVF